MSQQQLSLRLFADAYLGPTLQSYYEGRAASGGLAPSTFCYYREHMRWWTTKALTEMTPLKEITFVALEKLIRKFGPSGQGLKNVTLQKKLDFLSAAMKLAAARDEYDGKIPAFNLLRLPDDGARRRRYLTISDYEKFRLELAWDPTLQFGADFMFWTGHHRSDSYNVEAWMCDPNRRCRDEEGRVIATGMYLRRNTKGKKRVAPEWFIMHPRFREIVVSYYRALGIDMNRRDDWGNLVDDRVLTGHRWNHVRVFAKACERAEVLQISPTDLRRSFSSALVAANVSDEYIRHAMGHLGQTDRLTGLAKDPTIRTQHYFVVTPAMLSHVFTWHDKYEPPSPANSNQDL